MASLTAPGLSIGTHVLTPRTETSVAWGKLGGKASRVATAQLRRETPVDALVSPSAPPFFIWQTAEDVYASPEPTYRLEAALAAGGRHAVHVFAHRALQRREVSGER